jgi:hypothetical protein
VGDFGSVWKACDWLSSSRWMWCMLRDTWEPLAAFRVQTRRMWSEKKNKIGRKKKKPGRRRGGIFGVVGVDTMGKEITTLRRCCRHFWSRRRTQNNGKEELCVSLSLFFSLSLQRRMRIWLQPFWA